MESVRYCAYMCQHADDAPIGTNAILFRAACLVYLVVCFLHNYIIIQKRKKKKKMNKCPFFGTVVHSLKNEIQILSKHMLVSLYQTDRGIGVWQVESTQTNVLLQDTLSSFVYKKILNFQICLLYLETTMGLLIMIL